jgi:hypothetical protein
MLIIVNFFDLAFCPIVLIGLTYINTTIPGSISALNTVNSGKEAKYLATPTTICVSFRFETASSELSSFHTVQVHS